MYSPSLVTHKIQWCLPSKAKSIPKWLCASTIALYIFRRDWIEPKLYQYYIEALLFSCPNKLVDTTLGLIKIRKTSHNHLKIDWLFHKFNEWMIWTDGDQSNYPCSSTKKNPQALIGAHILNFAWRKISNKVHYPRIPTRCIILSNTLKICLRLIRLSTIYRTNWMKSQETLQTCGFHSFRKKKKRKKSSCTALYRYF